MAQLVISSNDVAGTTADQDRGCNQPCGNIHLAPLHPPRNGMTRDLLRATPLFSNSVFGASRSAGPASCMPRIPAWRSKARARGGGWKGRAPGIRNDHEKEASDITGNCEGQRIQVKTELRREAERGCEQETLRERSWLNLLWLLFTACRCSSAS